MNIPIYVSNTFQGIWVIGSSIGLIAALLAGFELQYFFVVVLVGLLFHTGKYIQKPIGMGYIKESLALASFLFYIAIYFLFEVFKNMKLI